MAESDNDSGGYRETMNSNRSNNQENNSHREQDRLLPIANVSRIMKKGLPANAKISKDAKETVQECVSEFISFITGEASDKCQREKRKTINGDDLLWAMTTLGFEEYVDPLKVYLQRFRDMEGEKCAMAGGSSKQEREVGNGSANVVNMVNTGVTYAREGAYGANGMHYQHQHIHPHQGHLYNEDLYGSPGARRPEKVRPGYDKGA